LLGAVDEISAYNFNIDLLAGWFKAGNISSSDMYTQNSIGSFAGEGSVMFYVDNLKKTDSIKVEDLKTLTTEDASVVSDAFRLFLQKNNLKNYPADLFMSGENGDIRMLPFYDACEALIKRDTPVLRFKHVTGEYATASSMALWIACYILRTQLVPHHMWKARQAPLQSRRNTKPYQKVAIYNNHKGIQHSFMLCSIGN
jgi:hypothetical protein